MAEKKETALPREALELLWAPGCGRYLAFADGQVFRCPSLSSPDGKVLALALLEEHTDFGRALVDALWFSHPVRVTLCLGKRRLGFTARVYRCHIAGPLFLKKLLEVRARNPEGDMASAWELRFVKEENAGSISGAKEPEASKLCEWHLDHPGLHS